MGKHYNKTELPYLGAEEYTLDTGRIGEKLRELRLSHGYTVDAIACFMGFNNPMAVYKWERGESIPQPERLFALTRLYGVTMDYLFSEKVSA